MIVNSQNIEFGYELISIIPYANYLASRGELEETISGNDTECLYYFSPKHTINPEKRDWNRTKFVNYPNIKIHKPYLDKEKFLLPDYKKQYANERFKFDKELLIICNRKNIEWLKKPINFFDEPTLKEMFDLLQDRYQVVYINIEGRQELYDDGTPIKMNDYEIIKHYPKCINIHELHKANNDLTFNQMQLMLFANCQKYITMNGGHAILSAFFGGENIILSKYGEPQAREIHPSNNEYYRWYHELGGQRVVHVPNEKELIDRIKLQWIDNEPIVNILVRTHKRPNYFNVCIKSILEQTYKNINIFVSIDDKENDYTIKYPVYPVFVEKKKVGQIIENNSTYGDPFPQNLYFNEMYKRVTSGLILILDDDDKFKKRESLQTIVNDYKKGNELLFWRVDINRKIYPCDENFGKTPVCRDIASCGFAFDSKYIGLASWEAFKRGDYRIAKNLYNNVSKIKFIDKVLTMAQDMNHEGAIIDIEIKEIPEIITVRIIKDEFHGQKMKHEIGEVKELSSAVANQLIRHGLAVHHKPIIEMPKDIIPKPINGNKVIKPKRVRKVVKPKMIIKNGKSN